MTPIDYIRVDIDILQRQNLSNTEKLILGLIKNFNSQGLCLGNNAIGQLVKTRPDTVSKIISKLESQKEISIENAQSKYRRIYFGEKPKVEEPKADSTLENNPPTLENNATYFGENSKHNRRNRTKRRVRTPKKTFVIPTQEEIESYITEKKLSINAEKFLKYFTASDWIDSKGNEVTSWKHKLLTWDSFNHKGEQSPGGGDILTRDADDSDVEMLKMEGVLL